MKPLKVYWHPNCSTCKKAVAFMRKTGVAHELVDLRERPPSAAEIGKMWQAHAGQPRKLFNVSGQAYRAANLKEKLPGMSDKEQKALLASDGLLVKRPFVLLENGTGLVGFDEATWRRTLAGR